MDLKEEYVVGQIMKNEMMVKEENRLKVGNYLDHYYSQNP
jgi:hypothetical protein